MASINTNISALNAQKSMIDQTNKSDQAIERLSTGLRINNAADDAAGTAIASKMEAQVRSLGVAIRNGHDAISMTQTAEGALGEMENILQRVRELAVQAGNSTLTAQDREAIQTEVSQLTDEINTIASSTNFNGVKLLDGSNSKIDFQVGVDASDSLSVDLESSSAADLGLAGSMGANVFTSGRVTRLDFSGGVTTVADVKLNGQNMLSAVLTDLSASTSAATSIVAGINLNTSVHGAVANGFNRIVGAEMGKDFQMTTTLVITTSTGAETIAIQSSMEALVDKINELAADVTATLGKNNSLILENTTGDSIAIGGGGLEVGFTEATYEGMYTLQNVDGSATVIELGNRENGYTTGIVATATASNMSAYGLSERLADGSTKGFAASNSALALTDDIRINDVQVGKTTLASAEAKVNAINAISDQTGVTATAETQLILELDFDQDATSVSFALNGNAVNVKADNSVYDVASAINAANINLEATAIENGRLKITSHSGGDIILGLSAVTAFVTSIQDANGHTQAVGASVTTRGSITLTSEDGGAIKLTDNTVANSGLAKLGLEGQSEEEVAGSGGVNVTTVGGATAALKNIDDAINTVSGFRASFGAVENRIDAKVNNLTTLKANTQAAQSRIEDADFAAETTNMTKAQILSQAATSMLAQANASKQNLLALLQG
jgi:flagellin